MPEQSGERSQDATPYRRQQAREKGQVAQSQDLASAVILVAGVLVLMSFGSALMHFMGYTMREQVGGPAWLIADRNFLLQQCDQILEGLAKVMLPILLIMMATAAGVQL
ncbi:MAG: EscU/YscU/HrcU family type III secretion system export apparatus switch protein, partial [Planctomycetales bacterium]|nr:EscU/YscU/HrcU family type III secretion system export apparatus switch protein [Planctomycetales bacterium]